MVNNNHCLRQGVENVDRICGERPGKKEELYNFREVKFAKIAEEMGCVGIRVEDPEKIAPALKMALKADAPLVVEVATAVTYDVAKPWAP